MALVFKINLVMKLQQPVAEGYVHIFQILVFW